MFASKEGHLDTVITLLEHGANSHVRNKVSIHMNKNSVWPQRKNAQPCTAVSGLLAVHVLVTAVSMFNVPLQQGMTASDVASLNKYSDVCEVLRLRGSPQTDTSNDIILYILRGSNILHYNVSTLLEYVTDIEYPYYYATIDRGYLKLAPIAPKPNFIIKM